MNDQSPISIMITGAGGAAVPSLIESLQQRGYRVLAADMDLNAIGLYTADVGFVIPAGSSPKFLPAIRDICRNERVRVLVSLVDEELLPSCEMEIEGVTVLLPKKEFITTCLDKFALMNRLQEFDIPVPKTHLASESVADITFPCIVKPRTGRGSRGVCLVKTESDLRSFLRTSDFHADELLVQEYIYGTEFTVSVVVWRDGNVQAVVPKEIISKKGITHLAVSRKNDRIEALCAEVQKCLHADGPFNVQLRIDSKRDIPLIFEINPRFSTTISLTIAAGVNELAGLLEQAIGKGGKIANSWKEGVVLMRRTSDTFLDESYYHSLKIKIRDYP